jgi:hypothetical protein
VSGVFANFGVILGRNSDGRSVSTWTRSDEETQMIVIEPDIADSPELVHLSFRGGHAYLQAPVFRRRSSPKGSASPVCMRKLTTTLP